MITGKHQFRSLFFKKVNRVVGYFHFWFYKLFLQKQPFKSDFQSSCSEIFSKGSKKTPATEFFFGEVGDCNFTIKELHQRVFPVNVDKLFIIFIEYLGGNSFVPFRFFWDFTSIQKAINKSFSHCTSTVALSKQ